MSTKGRTGRLEAVQPSIKEQKKKVKNKTLSVDSLRVETLVNIKNLKYLISVTIYKYLKRFLRIV